MTDAHFELINNVEEFKRLVRQHDLTHMYSDDYSVCRRGRDELNKIIELSKKIPRQTAVNIWNDNVDKITSYGSYFYWKE